MWLLQPGVKRTLMIRFLSVAPAYSQIAGDLWKCLTDHASEALDVALVLTQVTGCWTRSVAAVRIECISGFHHFSFLATTEASPRAIIARVDE